MRFLAALGLLLCLVAASVSSENVPKIVLPNPGLLNCSLATCAQLWSDDAGTPGAIFPARLSLDTAGSCIYGFTARYDPKTRFEEIRAAVDSKYGSYARQMNSDSSVRLKLWRVEPQKFSIQLSTATEQSDRETLAEAMAASAKKHPKPDKSNVTGIDLTYIRFMPVGTAPEHRCDVHP